MDSINRKNPSSFLTPSRPTSSPSKSRATEVAQGALQGAAQGSQTASTQKPLEAEDLTAKIGQFFKELKDNPRKKLGTLLSKAGPVVAVALVVAGVVALSVFPPVGGVLLASGLVLGLATAVHKLLKKSPEGYSRLSENGEGGELKRAEKESPEDRSQRLKIQANKEIGDIRQLERTLKTMSKDSLEYLACSGEIKKRKNNFSNKFRDLDNATKEVLRKKIKKWKNEELTPQEKWAGHLMLIQTQYKEGSKQGETFEMFLTRAAAAAATYQEKMNRAKDETECAQVRAEMRSDPLIQAYEGAGTGIGTQIGYLANALNHPSSKDPALLNDPTLKLVREYVEIYKSSRSSTLQKRKQTIHNAWNKLQEELKAKDEFTQQQLRRTFLRDFAGNIKDFIAEARRLGNIEGLTKMEDIYKEMDRWKLGDLPPLQ